MIDAVQLQQVTQWLEHEGTRTDMESALRADFPALHFTFCSDDDVMSDRPLAVAPGFHLYLVDSSNHCLCLTQDMASASGLVIAAIEAGA
jgi:hypothetical protein